MAHRRYCFTEETVLADVFVFLFKEQELRLAAKFKECVSALPLQALSRWSIPAANKVVNGAYLTVKEWVGVMEVTGSQERIVQKNIMGG